VDITRLKEKGARFKHVPTKEQIREAKAAKELAKDLEGIDTSNIIESGSRRRAASAAVLSFPKKRKAASDEEEDTESASESEEELVFD
jgi:ribosomal protein L12E/L44/L45/RPP1/RPP2